MKRLALWVGMLLAAGCGGGMDDPPTIGGTGGSRPTAGPDSRLTGNWIFIGDAAALALDFDGAKYVLGRIVSTGTTTGNVQAEVGIYATTAGALALTPQQASCAGPHPAYRESYSFSGGSLVISDASGTVVLAPNPSTGASVAITYGCFASDGTFTASPLAPVN